MRHNIKKSLILASLTALLTLALTGCGNYATEGGDGIFAKITKDKSGTLDVNTDCYHYYYLMDTGIVYAGFISNGGGGLFDAITPAISENGNYYRYNRKKRQVEEVVPDSENNHNTPSPLPGKQKK
jgi:hypothetical protein